MSFPVPKEALDDRLAVVGTAGSGKTYLTLGAAEHLLARKSRIIFVDPLGVAWGLRLCEDGKTASPFQPIIFGGAHGDLPINEHAGALIGEAVATMRESCIIDLSQLGTKASERRFMLAFLTALYRHTNKEPVHLIIDEADMFAPQKLLDKDGDAAKLLGMMETVVRRGRARGFIPWLLTQRPAVISKDVLSQADGVVALKLTAAQDRKAIAGWVESTADTGQWKAIDARLPTFQRGEGVLWIPGRGILREVAFPPKATFDSSRTPKRGEKRHTAELKPIDLGALKDRMAQVETETKANDPKALKAEISRLNSEIRQSSAKIAVKTSSGADLEAAERRGFDKGVASAKGAFRSAVLDTQDAVAKANDAVREALTKLGEVTHTHLRNLAKGIPAAVIPAAAMPRSQPAPVPAQRANGHALQPRQSAGTVSLPPGERAVLIAAAQFDGVEREQLTILTGYKRSSRDAYIQRLREKGYVELSGSTVTLTEAGSGALPADYEPLPTGEGLRAYWLGRLPEGERRILEVLIEGYPNAVERTDLDAATGYKRSSRDAYLQRMKAKQLWDSQGSSVRASEALFT